jgi:hypothetical protein
MASFLGVEFFAACNSTCGPRETRSWIAAADLISAPVALMRLLGWQAVARRTR